MIFAKPSLFKDDERGFVTYGSLRSNTPSHFMLSEYLQMIFVELDRFQKKDINKLVDEQEKWCYLLKESGRLTHKKAELLARKGEDMALALKFLHELSESDRRWAEEQAIDKHYRDQIAIREYAYDEGREKGIQEGRQEGRQEGMQKGIQKGMQKGMQKGIQKGIVEGMQAVALKMLKEKADMSFICKVTGLSEEEINKLKNGSC